MNDSSTRIAALLHEAGETHHLVYRIVDGDDPDWASWYADWLLNLSELPQILGTTPVRSEVVWLLVTLDKEYTKAKPEIPLATVVRGVCDDALRRNHRPQDFLSKKVKSVLVGICGRVVSVFLRA
jgi:hypothetical protein